MRKNYLAKLVKYMKNVFGIEIGLNNLTDGKKNPTFKTRGLASVLVIFKRNNYLFNN